MTKQGRFWDRISKRYYRSPIKDPDAYEHKLAITRSFFRSDMRILEFGCGTGGTAIAHAPHVRHIHAIDVSEKMLQYARKAAREKRISNITFEKNSIESFSDDAGSFDMILGLSVLHLLEDRDAVLNKVFRLLKPGGVFISSTACIGDNMPYFKFIVPAGRALGLFPIVKVFKQNQLCNELQAAGFAVTQQWRPEEKMAAFIVAEKTNSQTSGPVGQSKGEGLRADEADTHYESMVGQS